MTNQNSLPPATDWLQKKAQVVERPFGSQTPLVGPLIVRFRELWNSVSTKWFVRAIVQQQNEFNDLVVRRVNDLDVRLIEQDREGVLLTHTVAELTGRIIQLQRQVSQLESRLAQLEKGNNDETPPRLS